MTEFVYISILGLYSLISIALAFTHILQMQIAEYLTYKYIGIAKESGYLKTLLPTNFAFPAKSPRNILIAGFMSVLVFTVAAILFLYLKGEMFWILVSFPILWVAGKFGVLLGVLLTAPLSYLVRTRLILIAKRQLSRSKAEIIGVTGSYGKSTTKEILHRILSVEYLTGKTRGNHNTDVGIALEIGLQVTPATELFVAEMGAYRKGDISRLCRLYKPTYSVLTGVGNQHLTLFGSRENIKKEKSQILKKVARGGLGYLNADIEGYESILKEVRRNIITYGFNKKADAKISDLVNKDGMTHFLLRYKGKKEKYETALLGDHNVLNTLPAILIAKEFGMKYDQIFSALKDIEPLLGKLSLHNGVSGSTILNDSYNSNVNGFIAAIKVLKNLPQKEKYISTWGVFELGADKESSYREILKSLKRSGVQLITTDKLFASLGVYENISVYENEEGMLSRLKEVQKNGIAILVEGRHSSVFTTELGLEKAY